MKISIILPVILSVMFVFSTSVQSQTLSDSIVFQPEAEREFVDAMKSFKAGHFDTASVLFSRMIKNYPRSHRTTGAFIMGAKAFYELKNYQESVRLLKNLIDLYPQSTYIDDAHYTLALDYFRTGRYEDAASECIVLIQTSPEKQLLTRSEKLVEMLTSSYLTLSELQRLQPDAKSDEMKSLMTIRIAEKLIHIGDLAASGEMLHKIALLSPKIKYVSDALALLGQMENRGMKIGVVLPLMLKAESPSTRALGVEFLEGIQLAVDEYNQKVPLKISLEVRDTERDPSKAERLVADLCTDEKVSAIIGPISSNEVLASAGIANERGVPLITPTATANGIAAIGPFIFQANPDYDTQGRDAAAFAYNTFGARNFAVLAPADVEGKQLAESFIAEITSMGGEMIDVQWYAAGSMDLRMELTSMRRKALERLEVPTIDFSAKMRQSELNKFIKWGVNQHVLDSLIERGLTAPITLLFGSRGKLIADSLKIPMHHEHMKYDSLGLPVRIIDALFVPIASSEEIPIVSSQIKYFNIQAQILGTGDWNDAAALDQNRQYTDGVMFFMDSYPDVASETYRTFEVKYRLANNNKTPGTNAVFGYDVARMILQIVSQGNSRRKEIAAELANVEGFEGLHSQISLSKNRVNTYMSVLQYKGRQIYQIGKIDLARIGK
ncbi:MAG: ABC transporter substrate-binding protein [Bacteroidota bacterium]|jgi:ABC-type branched-subunit amino acid transport system substrate-binding protein